MHLFNRWIILICSLACCLALMANSSQSNQSDFQQGRRFKRVPHKEREQDTTASKIPQVLPVNRDSSKSAGLIAKTAVSIERSGQNYLLRFPDSTIIKMIPIPPGETKIGTENKMLESIIMRSGNPGYINESPMHAVRFERQFWIAETETSRNHFRHFLQALWPDAMLDKAGEDSLPAVHLSWYDAVHFCDWLGMQITDFKFRLPTECEWEYAAKGRSDAIYPWQHFYMLDSLANYGNKQGSLKSIYSYKSGKNFCGLYNMSGNAYEWCQNSSYDYASPAANDSLLMDDRAARGGSYANNRFECRIQARHFLPPGHKDDRVGFRFILEEAKKPAN